MTFSPLKVLGLFQRIRENPSELETSVNDVTIRKKFTEDLNKLLITRRPWDTPNKEFPEVLSSVVCYGLPDFSSMRISEEDQQEKIRTDILNTLMYFEPRLKNVDVKTITVPDDNGKDFVEFQIQGELQLSSDDLPVIINAYWSEKIGNIDFK